MNDTKAYAIGQVLTVWITGDITKYRAAVVETEPELRLQLPSGWVLKPGDYIIVPDGDTA